MDFNRLKETQNLYIRFQLSKNPFNIAPLFRNFRNENDCKRDENLFFLPEDMINEVEILLGTVEQRVLLYGLYGVGKTTFADFFLYLANNYHHRFCSRLVLTEDNLDRSFQELLHTLCLDIISEIAFRTWKHPVASVRKWIVENRHGDTLMESLACLLGRYAEIQEKCESHKSSKSVKLSPGNLGVGWDTASEIQIRKVIQSYVDVLPVRKVIEYLQDFSEIVQQIGFQDIVLFIDEADHLPKVEQFLRMLTRSRELLFTPKYSYFIAGSAEVARYIESMGTIFGHLVYLQPLTPGSMLSVLEKRVHAVNPDISLNQIFDPDSLQVIFKKSGGILKEVLRLAENSLKNAVKERVSIVTAKHCVDVIKKETQEFSSGLKEKQIKILKFLASSDYVSPSDILFQQTVQLSRSQLRLLLQSLLQKNYVKKETRGKKSFYSISSQYRPYFGKERLSTDTI